MPQTASLLQRPPLFVCASGRRTPAASATSSCGLPQSVSCEGILLHVDIYISDKNESKHGSPEPHSTRNKIPVAFRESALSAFSKGTKRRHPSPVLSNLCCCCCSASADAFKRRCASVLPLTPSFRFCFPRHGRGIDRGKVEARLPRSAPPYQSSEIQKLQLKLPQAKATRQNPGLKKKQKKTGNLLVCVSRVFLLVRQVASVTYTKY